MEPIPMAAFPYGEWDPLSLLFTNEDLDLTAPRVLGQGPHQMYDRMSLEMPAEYFLGDQAMPGICESFFADCNSLLGSSQEGSYASGGGFCGYYAEMPMEDGHCGDTFVPDFTGIVAGEGFCQTDDNVGGDVHVDQADHEASVPIVKRAQPKRKRANTNSCAGEEDGAEIDAPQNPKKRKPRAPKEKGKKAVQPKKKQKLAKLSEDEGEEGNVVTRQDGQTSTTCSLVEEDSVSQELNNGESTQNSDDTSALNSDGKTTRAGRGAATDPQSLYARRRRERINERLKVLQSLVPNGTKVDISTMLEEAVQYVKFLQLQIKLLSSDDMWMYAPIAYNGMDIGLNQMFHQLL